MNNIKLNVGCGGLHKKGYLNVDAYDDTVADKIMSADDLELDDNTVDEILLSQVIEHLGSVQSRYAISECFRVLRPGGKLIIETPDIKTAFKRYLKGNREVRKNILPWVYGVDMPGMLHRFCFPDDLLEEILSNCGFIEIKKVFFSYDKDEPILQIIGKKTNDYRSLQFISKFRKKLIRENLVDYNDQIPSFEKEELIKFFLEKLSIWIHKKNKKIIDAIAIEGSLYSPKMTYAFFEEMIKQSICSRRDLQNHCKIVKKLIELRFSDILLEKLTQINGYVGEQEKLYSHVLDFGKRQVGKLLNGAIEEQKKVIGELMNLSKKIDDEKSIVFFSPKLVMLKAYKLFQKGVKEFNLNNYEKAIDEFKKAEEMYRDQILIYWNLGRLYALKKNKEQKESYYNKCLSLINIIHYENKITIKHALQKEIRGRSSKKILDPLVFLYDI